MGGCVTILAKVMMLLYVVVNTISIIKREDDTIGQSKERFTEDEKAELGTVDILDSDTGFMFFI